MHKALLIFPHRYSYTNTINEYLTGRGWQVLSTDHQDALGPVQHKLKPVMAFMPGRLRKPWMRNVITRINNHYRDLAAKHQPELVYIYNNEFIMPETLRILKRHARVAFLLGDHPLYSLTFDHNLQILQYSDCTIVPDSHWKNDLATMGMPNLHFDMMAASDRIFHTSTAIPDAIRVKYSADSLFIGTCYPMASGYKRAMFLDSARTTGMKIYGPANWYKWLDFFPDLKPHFTLQTHRIPDAELNLALNCARICPIDQNQGIINGIHNRVFEAIGAGCLPVMEYRKDIDTVFGDLLPVVKKYSEARDVVQTWLQDDQARDARVAELRQHVARHYAPALFIDRLLERAFA